MACVHEFGILLDGDKQIEYVDYDPKRYDCITVDDDLISDLLDPLANMKTYFHSYNRPECGLAYCGITLIPHGSLTVFHEVVTSSDYFLESAELHDLAALIEQAAVERKDLIHFGI
ncbi:short-chain dehydrogenase [Sporosarcina sp. Te-1]|uniref:short-chain dehydrogenase n=1 Tax=Sporosarcina sp. Te-1 TaxID=2818390 RepID=UPI001A9FB4A4|nr:short-chain dehydrogenase [Sporosarcina sp. Te-1]QTD40120.1 short-chain dehydrogenase [Sporosarcina sp. Te-1]